MEGINKTDLLNQSQEGVTKEHIVSFNTAKLLKETGFDWDSELAYDEEGNIDNSKDYTSNDIFMQEDIESAEENEYPSYLAPTQSLARKWLRENQNLHIIVIPTLHNFWTFKMIDLGNDKIELPPYYNVDDNDYNNYEEALEAALQRVINLILKR